MENLLILPGRALDWIRESHLFTGLDVPTTDQDTFCHFQLDSVNFDNLVWWRSSLSQLNSAEAFTFSIHKEFERPNKCQHLQPHALTSQRNLHVGEITAIPPQSLLFAEE